MWSEKRTMGGKRSMSGELTLVVLLSGSVVERCKEDEEDEVDEGKQDVEAKGCCCSDASAAAVRSRGTSAAGEKAALA
jgi:hypothetical protein